MTANATGNTNRLARETSLYLRQHAHNPVEWYPWGDEALERARREDKPILLSIGYSACHWCHVMAHESFEDAATAALMNEHYVCIKVDREERPDLDKIYQTAHQMLTGRGGGWPLTLFLMPDDRTPFFAGTYFPNQPRYGMPSFADVLQGVAAFYRERRGDLEQQNAQLKSALQPGGGISAAPLTDTPLKRARELLGGSYDARHGGFGRAPKFPHPTNIERLLRHWSASRESGVEDAAARDMALHTLRAMAEGGIYDQLGGGFCRYSVDERWAIPHFEKMLYDNGPLLCLYTQAWQITRDPLFERVALETAQWAMREMQSEAGGFHSTLDADSEGEEGKFYVWTREQVQAELADEAMRDVFMRRYGFAQAANFEGHWNPCVTEPLAEIARERGIDEGAAQRLLDAARGRIFAARSRRVRPGRDEKILTSWNGLMIKGLALAGRVFKRPELIESAQRALDFARRELWHDGRLYATHQGGRARFMAYLDDHAFLVDAILELAQARWNGAEFQFAIELTETMLTHYEDNEHGGFFFTAHDHEKLIQRPKQFADDALPSGNGIAAHVLVRLGHVLGEPRYIRAAERTLRAAWEEVSQYPHGCDALLLALEELLSPGQTVIVRGAADQLAPWMERCAADYAPKRVCLAIPNDAAPETAGLAAYAPAPDGPVAYVCTGTQCAPPVRVVDELTL
jgi:uncharacterized protein YyaL (SSP411 family)